MSEDKPGTDKPTTASVGDAANPTAPPPPPPKAAAPVVKPAATAAAKPAAPAAPPKPAPVAWESELVTGLKRQYGSGIRDASIYLKDKYLVIDKSIIFDVLIRVVRRRAVRLLRGHHCSALAEARRAVRRGLHPVLLREERTHPGGDDDQRWRESAECVQPLADSRLAGARGLRHVWDRVHRASRTKAHPAAGGMDRAIRCARITASASRTSNGYSRTSESRADNEHNVLK